jgi:hypothetical protein
MHGLHFEQHLRGRIGSEASVRKKHATILS